MIAIKFKIECFYCRQEEETSWGWESYAPFSYAPPRTFLFGERQICTSCKDVATEALNAHAKSLHKAAVERNNDNT